MGYNFSKIRILVVDDNKNMAKMVEAMLIALGVGAIDIIHDGEAAWEHFMKNQVDIVLTDWKMEPLDGIALTRRVRTDPSSPNPYVPVILMTGFSERMRVVESRDAGVTEFLVKPLSVSALSARLIEVIERPRSFVKTDDYFGPDRRRKNDVNYAGPERRGSGKKWLGDEAGDGAAPSGRQALNKID